MENVSIVDVIVTAGFVLVMAGFAWWSWCQDNRESFERRRKLENERAKHSKRMVQLIDELDGEVDKKLANLRKRLDKDGVDDYNQQKREKLERQGWDFDN